MTHGSASTAHQRRGMSALCALLGTLANAAAALAQLTAADIAALQQQGQREGWTFEVGLNAATDRPLDDLCGLVVPPDWEHDARLAPPPPVRDLPARFDWRDVVGAPAVRDQRSCGSCWAFATVGPLEFNLRLKDGVDADLSEQWLVSCNDDGWSCSGGWWAHDYHQWKTDPCGGTGAVAERDFRYTATNAPCDCPYPHDFLIDDWFFIGQGVPPVQAIKQAIYQYGPLCVGVRADSAFQAYTRGVFNQHSPGDINHGVVLVGWDDNQGENGVWIMRNSWGEGWGERGYMRIAYGCSSIGYAATYVVYGASRPELRFEYPEGRPDSVEAGAETIVRVNVLPDSGTPVPGTGWLHASTNDGQSYFVSALLPVGPNEYQALLPPVPCYGRLRWYVSIEEQTRGRINDPPTAPLLTYTAVADAYPATVLHYDFESDQGWTVEANAGAGNWERADPEEVVANTPAPVITQPGEDHSPDGTLCFVTGAAAGGSPADNDVDGAPSVLISPAWPLAGRDAIVGYWRWFHISESWDDTLRVKVSNDDGATWVLVERLYSREEWTYRQFRVSDFVTPTDQVRIKFVVSDLPPSSLVEGLIDDVTVAILNCLPAGECPEDITRDGDIDLADLSQLLANYGLTGGATHADGDIDADGDVDLSDLSTLLSVYGTSCP